MRSLKHRIARFGVGLGLAATMALGAVVPALADDVTGQATVSAGSLAFSATDAPAVSAILNGTNQTPTDPFDISVNDARGSGAGWNLQITSTTFSTGGGTPKTLSNSAASITAASSGCDQGTCTNPTNGISYPVTVPADTAAPTPVKIFNAAADSGMGDFTITPTLQVAIPANTYAGTYSSTMTITIATGP
jgi:hypothetical protein